MNLDQLITKTLRTAHEKERAEHTRSGKLSAGQLSKPLLEQVLKIIGVPEAPISDYALRLFKRGNQVEDWIVDMLGKGEEQVEIDYKGVIGYADKVIDGVPIEVKSVKSSQWRWLEKEGARWSHKLQAGLYALGLDSPTYKLLYVVADDFRVREFELNTADISPDIKKIMNEVATQLKQATLPEFKPREDWQAKPEYGEKYSSYPEWVSLDPTTAMTKLKNQHKSAYERLQELSKPKEKTNVK